MEDTSVPSGQQEVHMQMVEMDPAPAREAGKDKVEKVWDQSHKALVSHGSNEDGHDEGQPFDEPKLVVAYGKDPTEKALHVPKSFFTREAFVELATQGLTKLPSGPKWQIAYHSQTRQWHARHEDHGNYAPSWGLNRSEMKALVLALQQLWDWYIQTDPADVEEAKSHLKRLDEFGNTISF